VPAALAAYWKAAVPAESHRPPAEQRALFDAASRLRVIALFPSGL
jgi:hypothetical protein